MPHSVHSAPEPAPPFWQVNVPSNETTPKCPDFLRDISEKTRRSVGTKDDVYRRFIWQEVQEIVRTNRLGLFSRVPSECRRYLEYVYEIKKTHGSVLSFILDKRLQWNSTVSSGKAHFTDHTDWKILYNDWPYGIETDVVHLVVWTKFRLEDDPITDDLTPRARDEVGQFIVAEFCGTEGHAREQLIWFKNRSSLKSVHALEHFHVMLYRPEKAFLESITSGDHPMIEQLQQENGEER